MKATTAREHAIRASELLNDLEERLTSSAIESPSVMRDLAQAHGITALALCMSDEDPNPDDAGGRFS